MKRIVFISKIPLISFPRLLNIPFAISELNYEIVILAAGDFPNVLKSKESIRFEKLNILERNNCLFNKLFNWISFRKEIKAKIRKLESDDILWLSSADSAIPLFGLLRKQKYILQINELYDKNLFYRFFLHKLSRHAKAIVVPEHNRANIFRVWFGLKLLPFVLPNKSILYEEEINLTNEEKKLISNINDFKQKGAKILIYQGHIGKDRDFSNLVDSLNELDRKVHLIIMGKDHNMVSNYKKIFNNITWIQHIKAPKHLIFTKLADIGIIYYNTDSLNNIYCAPNKTWEYSKFGLPIISNDIPGMEVVTKLYKAGISCNFFNRTFLNQNLKDLIDNYDTFSRNSLKMYQELDYKGIIKEIIEFS